MPNNFVPGGSTSKSTASRRLWVDKAARWVVTAGGLAIIASILGILVFLLVETLPLMRGARVDAWQKLDVGSDRILAVLSDPYRGHLATVDASGTVRVVRVADRKTVTTVRLLDNASAAKAVEAKSVRAGKGFALATSDGRVLVQPVGWETLFENGKRRVSPKLFASSSIVVDPRGGPVASFAATIGDEGSVFVAAQPAGRKSLVWANKEWNYNELAEEFEEGKLIRQEFPFDGDLQHLLINPEGREIFGVDADRRLLSWKRASVDKKFEQAVVSAGDERITAMGFLFGSRAFVLGGEQGSISVWFETRRNGVSRLTRARTLPPMSDAVTHITYSQRNKAFLAADRGGNVALYYATTSHRDWQSTQPVPELESIAIAPKVDGILATRGSEVWMAPLDHPHPESSIAAFASKVWYEGYEEPDYHYESTGGTDEFESKMSLMPLIFGTLKGTFFAMLLSIPLAVLGAMFVSQFLHASLRDYIKPAIEIMAAMPSVILGFIAALWLAPLLEVGFSAFLLMPLLMPIAVVLTGMAWMKLPTQTRARFPTGFETVVFVAALALTIWICVLLNRPVEQLLFDGDFPTWVDKTLGIPYEQKNSVVIAIAMSFAVIPIIFTISEDAFSNVPRNLVSGSLALGANRWQTVTRVVLPSASPGIFSATMVGFGRAVGETMIVLMATGNTAIMEWNPFNGFRTLSANIAVEIPEAPQGDTLYRTLFLAALILFILTFAINTLAEVVRQRLRRRYATL